MKTEDDGNSKKEKDEEIKTLHYFTGIYVFQQISMSLEFNRVNEFGHF